MGDKTSSCVRPLPPVSSDDGANYTSLTNNQFPSNPYHTINDNGATLTPPPEPKKSQSVWSLPFIVVTSLSTIMLLLVVSVLCVLAAVSVSSGYADFTPTNDLVDAIAQVVIQHLSVNNQSSFEGYDELLQATNESLLELKAITDTLSNLSNSSNSTAVVVHDILVIVKKLLMLKEP
uniref:Uncharacterized protein n=1 Tax=Amphimedon queenslandica TaxID=400682 RepID=A0A1X7UML7_AMPQE